jgi:hypothetical protein
LEETVAKASICIALLAGAAFFFCLIGGWYAEKALFHSSNSIVGTILGFFVGVIVGIVIDCIGSQISN